MRLLSVRLIVSLILGVALVSLLFSYYEVRTERSGLRKDLQRRAEVLGESLAGNVEGRLERQSPRELQRIVERFSNREHLAGVGVYDKHSGSRRLASGLAKTLTARPSW